MITLQLDPLQEAVVQRALVEYTARSAYRVNAATIAGHRAGGSEMGRLIAANLVAEIRAQHQADEPEAPCE